MPKGKHCEGCVLFNLGKGFAGPSGTAANGVLLLGETLDFSGAAIGKVFQGQDGHALTGILHKAGFKREDFLLFNVLSCAPPAGDKWYEVKATHQCSPYLEELLDQHPEVKVIMPMGGLALWKCLGVRGEKEEKNFHGSVTWHPRWKRWIVPTLDPGVVLKKGFKETPTMVFDITRAVTIAREGWVVDPANDIEFPTPTDLEWFVNDYEKELLLHPTSTFLSVDIETPYSSGIDEEEREDLDSSYNIIRASFSFKPSEAISFPWADDYLPAVKRALSSSGAKVTWNGWQFDNRRLEANNCTLGGLAIDGMEAWHFLYPDLPKGLGYVTPFFTTIAPWKNLVAQRPEFYSCVDARAALSNFLATKAALERVGGWQPFLRDLVALQPRLEAIHRVGLGIDETKREELKAHYEHLKENATLVIKDEIKALERESPGVSRKWARWTHKGEGYKGKPHDLRKWLKANPNEPAEAGWLALGYEPVEASLPDGGTETRWDKREEFNPASPQQVLDYIRDRYGDKEVPRHKKTGKPTASEEELERLARRKKDRILELAIDASSAGTLLSTFIEGWRAGKDGRVHSTLLNVPATFRLSSKNPNSQNFPHRGKEATMLRKMVVGGDEWEFLIEADFTGIEAIMVGWYAKDSQYVRLAKLGVHDYLAAHMMKKDGKFELIDLSLSDADLGVALRECKKVGKRLVMPNSVETYREAAKRTIHGSNYAMRPPLMHRNYPEIFTTVKVAADLQGLYFGIFPLILEWQSEVVERAYRDGMTVNAFGYRRRFFNVKRWNFSKRLNKWELVWSDDAKKAIATIPQGSAAAIIRRAMCSAPFQELLDAKAAMLQVHDSLLCRAKDKEQKEWVVSKLRESMLFPVDELGGLVVPIEVSAGPNWGEMETLD